MVDQMRAGQALGTDVAVAVAVEALELNQPFLYPSQFSNFCLGMGNLPMQQCKLQPAHVCHI